VPRLDSPSSGRGGVASCREDGQELSGFVNKGNYVFR